MQRVVSKRMPKGSVSVLLCAVFSSGIVWRHKNHAKNMQWDGWVPWTPHWDKGFVGLVKPGVIPST